MTTITIKIYEPNASYPVVIHKFKGVTRKEANQYMEAHMKYDSFFSAAMNNKPFQGMKLRVEIKMKGDKKKK